jgi:hypothetical protein
MLIVEEVKVTGWNQRPATSHSQSMSYKVKSSTPCAGDEIHNVIDDSHWFAW